MRTNPDLSTHPTADPARTALYLQRVVARSCVGQLYAVGCVSGLLLPLLLGCSSSRPVRTQLVRETLHDTLIQQAIRHDSVYIYRERLLERTQDTCYIHDLSVEYRYQLLHDTVRQTMRDSIPYEVRVTEVREVPRKRTVWDWFSDGVTLLVFLHLYQRLRIKY